MNAVHFNTVLVSSIGAPRVEQNYKVSSTGAVEIIGVPSEVNLVSVNLPPPEGYHRDSAPTLTIGALIKAKRAEKLLTQAELAQHSGLHRATIIAIEGNRFIPQGETVERLCRVLELDPMQIFAAIDTKTPGT
jgi:DNA-binding XRE family transcriptional regulator